MTEVINFKNILDKRETDIKHRQEDNEILQYANTLVKAGIDINVMTALAYYLTGPMKVAVCLTLLEFERATQKKIDAARDEDGWPFVV